MVDSEDIDSGSESDVKAIVFVDVVCSPSNVVISEVSVLVLSFVDSVVESAVEAGRSVEEISLTVLVMIDSSATLGRVS